jgi:superfamily II DNA or RNA helicase
MPMTSTRAPAPAPASSSDDAFVSDFAFRLRWRPYQARVLECFDRHIADRHFHVAAAPGAGKTVLGLEAVRRLRRPALVLAPTTAIRDQWLQRLREAFLDPDAPAPDWVSTDLESPAALTLATYQGLHAAQRRLGLPRLVERLRAAAIGTLALDEAHHLRNAWWQCLLAVKDGLDAPWVVALTATPPYDVPQAEWNRYIGLCGPLDAEVAVPELVRAGNLCPHQDYVYFTEPAEDEAAVLARFDAAVRALLDDAVFDPELLALFATHPLVNNPDEHLDVLSMRGEYALAILLYLQQAGVEHAGALRRTLGLQDVNLPPFGRRALQQLFDGLLFERDPLAPAGAVIARLERRLRDIGAVEQRRVWLEAPPHLLRLLEGSRSKNPSVAAIIDVEAARLGDRLRAVVLCDHIREDDFPQPDRPEPLFPHIGVVPVFEHLRRLRLPQVRLAVLTGSVVVLPQEAMPALAKAAAACAIPDALLQGEPLWHAPGYLRLPAGAALLQPMTGLFADGVLNVLVGTAALLGEGWDAPALNTLVLASAIGSAMGSNQMRGRAIRIDPAAADKVAHIWHLCCLHRSDDGSGGANIARLARRFRAFAGIGLTDTAARLQIENGIDRLALEATAISRADCDALNARMCRLAGDRDAVRAAWQQATGDVTSPRRMVVETRVPQRRLPQRFILLHALRVPTTWWPRWLRQHLLARRLRQIAEALLEAMQACGLLEADTLRIETDGDRNQAWCRLHGGPAHAESTFAAALRELLDLPQDPRYLLRLRDTRLVVPASLGGQRTTAAALAAAIARRLGRTELIYTRNDAGRRALIQARERWLAGRFGEGCDVRARWA